MPSASMESRSLNYSTVPCEFNKCYTHTDTSGMSKEERDREVMPPSLQTPKVEKEREIGKPRKRTEEFLAVQVHQAVPGRNRHQVHLRTDTWQRKHRTPSGGLPGFESQLCPNKQHALEHITSCL